MTDLYELGKTLKKNVKSIKEDGNIFSFETVDRTFTFVNTPVDIDKSSCYEKALEISYNLPAEYLQNDILEIFLKNDTITDARTHEKILEIPSKKILSAQNDGVYTLLRGSANGKTLVGISSKSDKIELLQIFATV